MPSASSRPAVAIMLVHRAENPSVTMEVGELGVLQGLVELRSSRLLQKSHVRPQPANRRALRIARLNFLLLFRAGIALLGGIHLVAINLVVPPRIAKVRGDHVGSRMHVANHALARRDGARELVLDGMAGLTLGDGGIAGCGLSHVAVSGVAGGVLLGAIIGVDHMAGAASTGAVIARLIVGSRETTAAGPANASSAVPGKSGRYATASQSPGC